MNFRATTWLALAGLIGIAAGAPPASAYVTALAGQGTGTEYDLKCPTGEYVTMMVLGRGSFFSGLEVTCQTAATSAGKLTGGPHSVVYSPGPSTALYGYMDYRASMGWWISEIGLGTAGGPVSSVYAEARGEPHWYYSLRCAGSDIVSGINVFFKYPPVPSKSGPTMRGVALRCAE